MPPTPSLALACRGYAVGRFRLADSGGLLPYWQAIFKADGDDREKRLSSVYRSVRKAIVQRLGQVKSDSLNWFCAFCARHSIAVSVAQNFTVTYRTFRSLHDICFLVRYNTETYRLNFNVLCIYCTANDGKVAFYGER